MIDDKTLGLVAECEEFRKTVLKSFSYADSKNEDSVSTDTLILVVPACCKALSKRLQPRFGLLVRKPSFESLTLYIEDAQLSGAFVDVKGYETLMLRVVKDNAYKSTVLLRRLLRFGVSFFGSIALAAVSVKPSKSKSKAPPPALIPFVGVSLVCAHSFASLLKPQQELDQKRTEKAIQIQLQVLDAISGKVELTSDKTKELYLSATGLEWIEDPEPVTNGTIEHAGDEPANETEKEVEEAAAEITGEDPLAEITGEDPLAEGTSPSKRNEFKFEWDNFMSKAGNLFGIRSFKEDGTPSSPSAAAAAAQMPASPTAAASPTDAAATAAVSPLAPAAASPLAPAAASPLAPAAAAPLAPAPAAPLAPAAAAPLAPAAVEVELVPEIVSKDVVEPVKAPVVELEATPTIELESPSAFAMVAADESEIKVNGEEKEEGEEPRGLGLLFRSISSPTSKSDKSSDKPKNALFFNSSPENKLRESQSLATLEEKKESDNFANRLVRSLSGRGLKDKEPSWEEQQPLRRATTGEVIVKPAGIPFFNDMASKMKGLFNIQEEVVETPAEAEAEATMVEKTESVLAAEMAEAVAASASQNAEV